MTPTTFQLSNVAELITKGTTPPRSMGGFSEVGVNYIKSECLSYTGAVDTSNLAKISPEVHQNLKRSQLKEGDILYSIAGANLGKCGIVPAEILPANTNQAVAIIRLDKTRADPRFVSFFLRNPRFVRDVLAGVAQSAQPNVNLAEIGRYELPAFSLSHQMAIGDALGALDDKIELNRRMNETLEEMARALFRDWFVDFGPTRRQMEGATDPATIMGHAFPSGQMPAQTATGSDSSSTTPVNATTLAPLFPAKIGEDGLPEGWEERPLDQIGQFLNGLALQKFPAQSGKPDLPVIKIAELRSGVSAKSNRASTDVPEKYVIGNGDFVFSWSGSLLAKFWTGGAGALNQHLFKVTSESYPMWFVSEWIQTHLEGFKRIAESKAVTIGHIKRSHLTEAICVCPPDESLTAFGEVFDPLISKQFGNDAEIQTLAALRDLLLPKLMSGEIRLKDAELLT